MRHFRTIVVATVIFSALILALYLLSLRPVPSAFTYGASFNTPYARELGLDWKAVYLAMLTDLGVRHLRLAAHWPMIEPERNTFHFDELDFQIAEAEARGVDVVLAVGRRLPRWPECHVPEWARGLSWEEQKEEVLQQITAVVNRYKGSPAISHWQVENEPYLSVFANEYCGDLDEAFFKDELALVKKLDPKRPILVTDSGNLGLWYRAYRAGDAFGTSLYMYFWEPTVGPFKSKLPPAFYRIKWNALRLLFGEKPSYIIELSVEPWLVEPIAKTPIGVQLERMDLEKFKEIIAHARETGFARQYLWGPEWWYWLRERGEPGLWEYGKEVFNSSS